MFMAEAHLEHMQVRARTDKSTVFSVIVSVALSSAGLAVPSFHGV
jgi:hypothetical protein